MDLRVLGGYGSAGVYQRPSAFLINGRTLLDAGTVPGALTVPEQLAIEHALISHAHLDHTVGLAFLAETLALITEAERHASRRPARRAEHAAGRGDSAERRCSTTPSGPTSVEYPRKAPCSTYGDLAEGPRAARGRPVGHPHRRRPHHPHVRIHRPRRAHGARVLRRHGPDHRDLAGRARLPRPGRRHPRVLVPQPARQARRGGRAPDPPPHRARAGQAAPRPPRLDLPHQGALLRRDGRGADAHPRRLAPRPPGAGQDLHALYAVPCLLALDQGTTSLAGHRLHRDGRHRGSGPAGADPVLSGPRPRGARSRGDLGEPARHRAPGHGRGPASARRTSPRSASPTSARPSCCGSARPGGRSTAPSSGRIAAPPTFWPGSARPATTPSCASEPGSSSIRTSRRARSPGSSITCPARGPARRPGELAAGTVDAWLVSRLTGGDPAPHRREQRVAHAAVRHPAGPVGPDASSTSSACPGRSCPRSGPSSGAIGETDRALFGRPLPIAGLAGDQQAALFGQLCIAPRHGEEHVRHGLLHADADGPAGRGQPAQPPDHGGLAARRAARRTTRSRAASSWGARPSSGCATAWA